MQESEKVQGRGRLSANCDKSQPKPAPSEEQDKQAENESKSSVTGAVDEMDIVEKEKESVGTEREPKEDDERQGSEVTLVVTDAVSE